MDDTGIKTKTKTHYVHMIRKFNEDGVIRWAIFGSIYSILFIIYLFSSDIEVIYALYIPFDYLTTASLALFYFYYRWKDNEFHK